MSDNRSFQRFAAVAAIFAGVTAILSMVLALTIIPDAISDPSKMLMAGPEAITPLRWAALFNMLGYYLLLAPVALVLWKWLGPKSPNFAGFYTLCGLTYILTGAMGVAVWWGTTPKLVTGFATATGSLKDAYEVAAILSTALTTGAFTDVVGMIPAAVWWIGMGLLLVGERRALSIVTVLLGVGAAVYSAGAVFARGTVVADIGLFMWFILTIVWGVWIGIDLLRKPAALDREAPAGRMASAAE